MPGHLVLVRHGETAWSRTGRHTGRTDIPLTDDGRAEAASVAPTLVGWTIGAAVTSPLTRAKETAEIAGFPCGLAVDDQLVEWDYGQLEGLTQAEIVERRPGFSKWHDPVPLGESPDEVGERADDVIRRWAPAPDGPDVVLFAHGHLLAILAARWTGLPAVEGRRFPLETATITVLGTKRNDRVIRRLNHRCGLPLPERPAERAEADR